MKQNVATEKSEAFAVRIVNLYEFLSGTKKKLFYQVFNDFSGENESDNRRDEGGAAGDLSARGAFPDGAGRTNTMRFTGDRHIFDGGYRFFFGIDDLQSGDVPLL